MKLTLLSILVVFSFSAFAFSPENVKCLKDAKKQGLSMEEAYQSCSVGGTQTSKKRK